MSHHILKTWPAPFSALVTGKKKFEFRKNDRDFKAGDVLRLDEFDPLTKKLSGRSLFFDVPYVIYGPEFKIPKDYCIMSLERRGMLV